MDQKTPKKTNRRNHTISNDFIAIKSKSKEVRLGKLILYLGIIDAILLISILIWAYANQEIDFWILFIPIILVLILIVAYYNWKIVYNYNGFIFINYFGFKSIFRYDELTSIEIGLDTIVYVGGKKIKISMYAEGAEQFVYYCRKQFLKTNSSYELIRYKDMV